MKIIIEQISFWGAILGTLLLALHLPISGWAYIILIASNAATLFLLKKTDAPKVVSWQIWAFVVINVVGIFCWLT